MAGESPREVVEQFWAAIGRNDFKAAAAFLSNEYVLEWPQSGERIRGPENFVALNEHYPAAGPWRSRVDHIVAEDNHVATDVTVTDGATTARALTFSEVRDGKIVRQTEYWPDPFEAAPWRAQWVERF